MNKIQEIDIKEFAQCFELANELQDSIFLITGATGLIGSNLIFCMLALKRNIRIIAPVRNLPKAKTMFGEYSDKIELIECDIVSFDYNSIGKVDYIIHCAAPTSSKFFVEKPVETFNIILDGTNALLKFAQCHSIKGFVYMSSLEVYGECLDGSRTVTEAFQGYLDLMSVRSSYPMAKRAVENLCTLYAKEYDVPIKVARLTQTTGAGIAKDDNRIIAQFARLAANGEDIVLHTTGEAARPYCYTMDCVSAILYILLKGNIGEAYNVANEGTYISAREMAEFLRDNFNPTINVVVEPKESMGYAPVTKLRLSSKKLMDLGWQPKYDLNQIFERLIIYLNS